MPVLPLIGLGRTPLLQWLIIPQSLSGSFYVYVSLRRFTRLTGNPWLESFRASRLGRTLVSAQPQAH